MSGPKDYRFVFHAVRQAELEQRRAALILAREEELRRRAAANRARLDEAARTLLRKRLEHGDATKVERESKARERQETIAHELAEMARSNREKLSSQRSAFVPVTLPNDAVSVEESKHEVPSEALHPSSELLQTGSTGSEVQGHCDVLHATLQDSWAEVLTWREELRADADVRDFEEQNLTRWEQLCGQCEQWVEDGGNEHALAQAVEALKTEAKVIHGRAGDSAIRFATRNELLEDIISSLKEVGFVVTDPQFEDSANPAGPILLVATRGDEKMEATIDLSDHIESTWNNLEASHCESSFRAYMNQMSEKGIEVIPEREDLRQKPIRIEKGALDLPRSQHKPA